MNQIPQEGEYCKGCPCLKLVIWNDVLGRCQWQGGVIVQGTNRFNMKRLPICLEERPKIVKGE